MCRAKLRKKCTICDRLSHFFLRLSACACLPGGRRGRDGQKKQRSVSRRTSETNNSFHENDMTVSHIKNYYVKKFIVTAKLQ